MKKVYSQRAGTEVFALSSEQLEVFRKAGYETPTAAEAIADAGAVKLTPPAGVRAYVAFDFKKGEFFVRVRTCTVKGGEVGKFAGEVVQASITARMAENADPDRPKAQQTATAAGTASPLGTTLTEAIKKAILGAITSSAVSPAPAAESEEAVE